MLLFEHQFHKWGKKILFNGIAREVLLFKPPKSKHMPNIKRNVCSVFSVHSSVSIIIKEKDRCTNFIHFYLKFLFPYFTSSNQHSICSENIAINDKCSHYIHVFFFFPVNLLLNRFDLAQILTSASIWRVQYFIFYSTGHPSKLQRWLLQVLYDGPPKHRWLLGVTFTSNLCYMFSYVEEQSLGPILDYQSFIPCPGLWFHRWELVLG